MVPRGNAGGYAEEGTKGFKDLGMEMAAIPRPAVTLHFQSLVTNCLNQIFQL